VGAYEAAMFHLFTHAFFKALLFLGAGSVIHGMHHEQDMRKMGALWKYMPFTYAVMTIGTIAITGVGIPGVFGFAGFYSKDTIIEAAFAAGQHSGYGLFAFVIGVFAAGLTAFYSWRLAFMTFHGTAKWGHDAHHADDHGHDAHAAPAAHDDHGHDDHGHGHDHKPHESPLVMLVPLALLAIGAIAAGFVFVEYFVGHHENEFWRGAIFSAADNHVLHEAHNVPTWVKWSPLVVSTLGLLIAVWVYLLNEGMGARLAANRGPLWTFLYNKWFFDELYEATFVRAARFLGDVFWKVGDQKIIDGLGPDGVAAVSNAVGKRTGQLQTGYVYHYAFVMLLGVAGLLSYALYQWSR
jgi:NADH-quinone oxidoreductase subunit L